MQHKPFFPDPVFGWSFFALLMVLLLVAAVIDLRTTRIPKVLTISIAAGGIIANVVRCAWLAGTGRELWLFPTNSVWYGALDGLLFSLLGLLFAFFLFFGMWVLGSCGGGDVKLCAGIGAWIGAEYTLFLLLGTVVTLVFWIAGRIIIGGMPLIQEIRHNRASSKKKRQKAALRPRQMTFSVPAAVSAAAVMLWVFRIDLQLAPQPPVPDNEAKHASVVPANE